MLDIGWPELFLIAVVTIVVVGPRELPRVVRTVSGVIRKVRGMAAEFQSTLDDMAREADLDDIKKEIVRAGEIDPGDEFKAAVDPSGDMDGAFDLDETPPAGSGDTASGTSGGEDEDRAAAPAGAEPAAPDGAEPPAGDAAGQRPGA